MQLVIKEGIPNSWPEEDYIVAPEIRSTRYQSVN